LGNLEKDTTMSIQASDILTAARGTWGAALYDQIIADTAGAPTLLWCSAAVQMLFRRRQDIRLDSNDNYIVFTKFATVDDVLDIEDVWTTVLADYVAARGFYYDGENPGHQERGDKHMELFKAFMGI
jgi:hypothetical protein